MIIPSGVEFLDVTMSTTISPRSPRDKYIGAGDLTHREVQKDVINRKARTKLRLSIILDKNECGKW